MTQIGRCHPRSYRRLEPVLGLQEALIQDPECVRLHAERCPVDYNTVRPREALSWDRPHDVNVGLADPRMPNFPELEVLPTA